MRNKYIILLTAGLFFLLVGCNESNTRRVKETKRALTDTVTESTTAIDTTSEGQKILTEFPEPSEVVITKLNKAPDHTEDTLWNAKQHNTNAMLCFKQKKYGEAVKELDTALQLWPNNGNFYFQRGLCKSNIQRWDEAIQDYSLAYDLTPENPNILLNLSQAYIEKKEYVTAIDFAERSVQQFPDNYLSYYNLGIAFAQTKQYSEAITQFSNAIEKNPEHAGSYNNRGNTYYLLQKYKLARSDWELAASKGSTSAQETLQNL